MKLFKNYKTTNIVVKGRKYKLWIADTPSKKSLGLSKVKKLPKNCGMIFVYDSMVNNSFTMKNTSIPLHIIFLDDKFKIVDQFNCRPFHQKSISPVENYKYVIEISPN